MIFCLLTASFLFSSFAFASWDKRLQLRWMQLYRYDLRRENEQLYINRFSLAFNYLDAQNNSLFKLTPFFEARRNIDLDLWERKEAGLEIGKDIFSWFYLGQALQYASREEDRRWHMNYEKDSAFEAVTTLMFKHSLLANEYINLKGFISGEYAYDFDAVAGACNELAIGAIMPIGKYVEAGLDWRHIDRIHYYDSDVVEASLTLVF